MDKYQTRYSVKPRTEEDRNMKIRGIEQMIAHVCLSGAKRRLRQNNKKEMVVQVLKLRRKGAAEPNAGGHEPLFYTLQKRDEKIRRKPDWHGDDEVDWCM